MKRKDKDMEALWAEVKRLTLEMGRLQQQYDEQTACVIVHRGLMLACSDAMRAAYYDERRRAERLREERDALARENEAMKRCATKYLEWLGVTHMPLDQALRDDMHNPKMCGDAALEQEDE